METSYQEKDKLLIFEMTEEIDHHTTEKIRRKMDHEITRYMPRKIVFNFNQVTFMDSAGIGMLMGRSKLAKMLGRKVLEMSGVLKIIPLGEDTMVG